MKHVLSNDYNRHIKQWTIIEYDDETRKIERVIIEDKK